jgi:hypothetical protein
MSGVNKIPKNPRRQIPQEPKILGVKQISDTRAPTIVDRQTKAAPVKITQKQTGETVTVESYVRRKPRKKSDPEVRLHVVSKEQQEEWDRIKRNEWEVE